MKSTCCGVFLGNKEQSTDSDTIMEWSRLELEIGSEVYFEKNNFPETLDGVNGLEETEDSDCERASLSQILETPFTQEIKQTPKYLEFVMKWNGRNFTGVSKPHLSLFTPLVTKGKGVSRKGKCQICFKWFSLKTGAYCKHMNLVHGLHSDGSYYRAPKIVHVYRKTVNTRSSTRGMQFFYTTMCVSCKNEILIGARRRYGMLDTLRKWYRHVYECRIKRKRAVKMDKQNTRFVE